MRIKPAYKVTAATIIIPVLIVAGLLLWLRRTPLVEIGSEMQPGGEIFDSSTAVGRVFDEVQRCGEQQKNLYQCIEAYRQKNGRLPDNMDELKNDVPETAAFTNCPSGLTWYEVHFENYGKRNAVLIEGAQNKHPTAFKLWIRGIKPQV